MNCYLKAIVLLGKDNSRRIVPLQPGVNIITGDSKTGKSALVEIIDYCLCSSHCSVPKGIITEYTSIYCILIHIDKAAYCVARRSAAENGHMYFLKMDDTFAGSDISMDMFTDVMPSSVKEVQQKIETALGMTITNLKGADEQSRKPSLRNMVSYMFQHQNLIASKFALFYRFTDSAKRKDTIEQFPIFAGLVDQQYYSELIYLESLSLTLRRKQRALTQRQKTYNYVQNHLLPLVKDYYALLHKTLPETKKYTQIISLAQNLPEFDDSSLFQDDSIVTRYHALNAELEYKRDQRRQTLSAIESLKSSEGYGNEYDRALNAMQEQVCFAPPACNEYTCPLCGNHLPELSETDKQLAEAAQWLNQELTLTSKYTHSFAEDIRKLQEQSDTLQDDITLLLSQIRKIEKKYIQSHDLVTLREKVNYAKSQIHLYLETISFYDESDLEAEIENLKSKIDMLKAHINGYDVETMLRKAENFLNRSMDAIAEKLDFEEEYKPIDLNFALTDKTFDLYHHQNHRDKIYLFEMGSGANWLSCHIALFLSFLHYFASQKESPMPLFQFYDQPSQVYFPQGLTAEESRRAEHSSDLKAVNKIYNTFFEEVELIKEETGITPQLIIVDHVTSEVMDHKNSFDAALRCEWRNGNKLI